MFLLCFLSYIHEELPRLERGDDFDNLPLGINQMNALLSIFFFQYVVLLAMSNNLLAQRLIHVFSIW